MNPAATINIPTPRNQYLNFLIYILHHCKCFSKNCESRKPVHPLVSRRFQYTSSSAIPLPFPPNCVDVVAIELGRRLPNWSASGLFRTGDRLRRFFSQLKYSIGRPPDQFVNRLTNSAAGRFLSNNFLSGKKPGLNYKIRRNGFKDFPPDLKGPALRRAANITTGALADPSFNPVF